MVRNANTSFAPSWGNTRLLSCCHTSNLTLFVGLTFPNWSTMDFADNQLSLPFPFWRVVRQRRQKTDGAHVFKYSARRNEMKIPKMRYIAVITLVGVLAWMAASRVAVARSVASPDASAAEIAKLALHPPYEIATPHLTFLEALSSSLFPTAHAFFQTAPGAFCAKCDTQAGWEARIVCACTGCHCPDCIQGPCVINECTYTGSSRKCNFRTNIDNRCLSCEADQTC